MEVSSGTGLQAWFAGYYHEEIERLCRFVIPERSSVLVLGCGTGELLAALGPARGLGIDRDPAKVAEAARRHPGLEFRTADAESLELDEKFDYVVLADLVGTLVDVQRCFEGLRAVTRPDSRVVVTYYNFVWQPILRLAEWLGLRAPQPEYNWLGMDDLANLLELAGFEPIRRKHRMLLPIYVPLVSELANKVLSQLPGLRHLTLVNAVVARPPNPPAASPLTVSVVVPTRNERGNVEGIVARTPEMGAGTQLVFIDGNSTDGTAAEIERQIGLHPEKRMMLLHQGSGVGKGDAVRKAFDACTGDVLMILDADITVPPEDLPKFYEALASGKGDFINGTRLVYPMEQQAMRFLNLLGNKFFSLCFTWLLDQRLKDTLCGTKVLRRSDYLTIKSNRWFFGDFDPFGDFDLLFGASKANLKIVEIPIRYKERTYGTTNISRFRHGWLLLKMCAFAYTKLKIV
ncbi:MAG: glycosyltransferase [Candidatus Wallbacteria bacterium]|nr:glycosyltransferase [Candidatus Wallbacteria bacterium]